MAFIERKDPVVLNIKLTSKGRELLAAGGLDFKYYALGDSEIDYDFNREIQVVDSEYSAFDQTILRPADKNGKPISFITRDVGGDSYNDVSINPAGYSVENQVESLGFFTNNNTEYIIDSNHVKQPDAMVYMETLVTGGNSIELLKAPTYGTSGEEPAIGDILFIKWTKGVSTTGFTINTSNPTPHLFYRITGITSGSLGSGTVVVEVDREIPDFGPLALPNIYAGAMIYYNEINFSGDTIVNLSPTDYLDESVLSFLENSQCPTIVFPYWNMSVIYTEEIAGVQSGNLKYTQFKNRALGGFVSYIQNQAPTLKKLGVVHYSNSSPANVYGEGFLNKIGTPPPTLDIPTIMWHKSVTQTLGTTLSPIGGQQLLAGLDIYYYDLADSEGFVVGKMFPDLKIFVIEDQELLFAMSYKSNRSWTLPDYTASTVDVPDVVPPPTGGNNVTWASPTNTSFTGCIITPYTGPMSGVEYCHCSIGWTCLPDYELGCSLSLGNVCDAGYRMSFCNYIPVGGSTGTICARDYVTSTTIDTCDCAILYGTGSETVTLIDKNNSNGIVFKGSVTD